MKQNKDYKAFWKWEKMLLIYVRRFIEKSKLRKNGENVSGRWIGKWKYLRKEDNYCTLKGQHKS